MPPQPAASGNASLTARLRLGRQLQSGDVRKCNATETLPAMIAALESGAVAATTQRLPSTRPIDHRWDRSRGVIFANARRPLVWDYTWSGSNGIVFQPASTQSRAYAIHRRGSSPAAPIADKKSSLVNQPNQAPNFSLPSNRDGADHLLKMEEELKETINDLKSELAAMTAKVALNDRALAYRESENAKLKSADQRRAVENRLALEKMREEEKDKALLEVKAEVDKYKTQYTKAVEDAKRAASRTAEVDAQLMERDREVADAKEEYLRELNIQKRNSEREQTENIEAVTQRRQLRQDQERSSYDAYHKVFDDLKSVIAEFSGVVLYISSLREQASKHIGRQHSPSVQINKIDSWIAHTKYRTLLERLDRYHIERQGELKQDIENIKLLQAERQGLQATFRHSAHASRVLTRYHRLSGPPSMQTTTETFAHVANEQPLHLKLTEIDMEIRKTESHKVQDSRSRLLQKKNMHEINAMRSTISRICSVFGQVRKREALRALLNDSVIEKEVFIATQDRRKGIANVDNNWRAVRDQNIPGGHTSAIMEVKTDIDIRLREYEGIVRRRFVLEQSLGDVPVQREQELDAAIRVLIEENNAAERAAWDSVVRARAMQSPSFVRTGHVVTTPLSDPIASAPASRTQPSASEEAPISPRRSRRQRMLESSKGPDQRVASTQLRGETRVAVSTARCQQGYDNLRAQVAAETDAAKRIGKEIALEGHKIAILSIQFEALPPLDSSAAETIGQEIASCRKRVNLLHLKQVQDLVASNPDDDTLKGRVVEREFLALKREFDVLREGPERKIKKLELSAKKQEMRSVAADRLSARLLAETDAEKTKLLESELVHIRKAMETYASGSRLKTRGAHILGASSTNKLADSYHYSPTVLNPAFTLNMNMQPTAAKQSIHSSWPAGYRQFHEQATNPLEDTHNASDIPPVPLAYDLPKDRTIRDRRHYTDVYARDPESPSPQVVNGVTDVGRPPTTEYNKPKTSPNTKPLPEPQPASKPEAFPVTAPAPDAAPSQSTEPLSYSPDMLSATAGESLHHGDAEGGSNSPLDDKPSLTYQISKTDYRNAAIASKSSSAAFWSYKLYKNTDGQNPKVHYCTTLEQAEKQAQRFLDEPIIGFDIEWEPFISKTRTDIKDNVSLIQIATEGKIALFHVACFAGDTVEQLMPPSLRKILESERTIKTGVNITGDARRMKEYLDVDMKAQFELSHLYKVVTYSNTERRKEINWRMVNLAEQVQNVLLLPLKKDEVRVSAWSKRLNIAQVEYSASDAYAGFRLFHALEAKRRKMTPMPPRPAFFELQAALILGDGTVLARKPKKKPIVAGKAAVTDEDADEEFFDALESLDIQDTDPQETTSVPPSGGDVVYPTLPPLDTSPLDSRQHLESQKVVDLNEPMSDNTTPGSTAMSPATELEHADLWIASWRAALPTGHGVKVGHRSLQAWCLWHEQSLEIVKVASIGHDPPLTPVTVASHILQAIKEEGLPYDIERVKEVLDLMPTAVLGRYQGILEKLEA